jgi:hypothetical protein
VNIQNAWCNNKNNLGSVFKDGFNTSNHITMNEHITDKLLQKDVERITHGVN